MKYFFILVLFENSWFDRKENTGKLKQNRYNILLILCSIFLISCEKEYTITDPSEFIDIPHDKEDPYKPETNLPEKIRITGRYTFTKNDKNFQFESENQDLYCYKVKHYIGKSSEDIILLRFRLYDIENKLLNERLPFTSGRRTITEFQEKIEKQPNEIKKENVTVWTYIPYHKDGVKIKAVLVDDTGKDLKVLAERGILSPEEFRERHFYKGCYRQVGFGIE